MDMSETNPPSLQYGIMTRINEDLYDKYGAVPKWLFFHVQ